MSIWFLETPKYKCLLPSPKTDSNASPKTDAKRHLKLTRTRHPELVSGSLSGSLSGSFSGSFSGSAFVIEQQMLKQVQHDELTNKASCKNL
ncbi:MAG: hypothetical protein LBO62_07045 [Endomicrobium sp.]|nr:hypothetical protein [Endomicrobium sp.]